MQTVFAMDSRLPANLQKSLKPERNPTQHKQTKCDDRTITDQWCERGRKSSFPAFKEGLRNKIGLKGVRLCSCGKSIANALEEVEPHS